MVEKLIVDLSFIVITFWIKIWSFFWKKNTGIFQIFDGILVLLSFKSGGDWWMNGVLNSFQVVKLFFHLQQLALMATYYSNFWSTIRFIILCVVSFYFWVTNHLLFMWNLLLSNWWLSTWKIFLFDYRT